MAVHIFRREATYYWRRRVPRALAIFQGRPHVFMSLRTTSPVTARRLATQLDAILEDAAMLAENADLHLRHLIMLRKNDLVPTKDHVLRQMIEVVKAVPTAMNVSVAQGTYFRGMKLALAEIDRRYGGQRIEDGDVVEDHKANSVTLQARRG